MARMFGTVRDVRFDNPETMEVSVVIDVSLEDAGRMPREYGGAVQLLTGFEAVRGVMASDQHNALVGAREALCEAIRAQILEPESYELQRRMIAVLNDVDGLIEQGAA